MILYSILTRKACKTSIMFVPDAQKSTCGLQKDSQSYVYTQDRYVESHGCYRHNCSSFDVKGAGALFYEY